jgi:hypothetical protein
VAFEIDDFTLEGSAAPTETPGTIAVTGTAHRVRRAHPLIASVTTFR